MLIRFLIALPLGLLLVFFSVRVRMLTLPGALLAMALLLVILPLGGYAPAAFILILYALCAAVHAYNKRRRNRHSDGARGLRQVAANGLFGGVAILLSLLWPHPALTVAYYAAITEFFADTLASDIGTLMPGDPIDLCRLRRIPRGRSGGVSALGTLASLCGCGIAAALMLLFGLSPLYAAFAAAAAFLGMLFDSVLGSLLQAKYRCRVCGDYTEKPTHCAGTAERIGGIRLLDNSNVNLLSTLFSALLAVLAVLLFG